MHRNFFRLIAPPTLDRCASRTVLIWLLAVTMLAGCETMKVTRLEPHTAPVAFSTYAWGQSAISEVPGASAQLVELDADMRAAVTAEMQSRGYRLVDNSASADMVVDYQVAVVEEQFAGDGNDPTWDTQFDPNAPSGVVELPATSGAPRVTLTLGIGRADGPAIWGGSATKLLTKPESTEGRRRLLQSTVRNLLQDLPPAAQ